MCSCYFYAGNLICRKAAVDGYFISPRYTYWKDETAPDQPVLQDGVTLSIDWTNDQTTIPLKLYDGVGVTELWVSVDGKDYIKVDGFSGGTGSITYDYTPVLEGGHTYRFKAVDAAGNTSAESDRFTVKLDQTKPVIGTLTYENAVHLNLWHWIIGKTSMVVHVPVTDTGSGVKEIRYTMTPEDAAGNPDESKAVEKTATVTDGEAQITFADDFRGTIAINCTDAAGNAADSVRIGAGADGVNGVIVEDRAPDITVQADRNPSDTVQTHPDGVAVSEGYYDSAPALLVTVKDDTDHAITAGIASVTYKVEDSAEKPVTVNGSALQADVSFTIPAAEIPTGSTWITVTATDNAGNQAVEKILIKIKGPEKQPAAKIDYRREVLTGLVPEGEYLIDGKRCKADKEGCITIADSWFRTTISIVRKGNGSETTDSPAQNLLIPARPAIPEPGAAEVSYPGAADGAITGLSAGMVYEYRRQNDDGTWEEKWTPVTAADGKIGGLREGTYEVRVAAVDHVSFRSEAAAVSISAKPAAKMETPDIRINYMEETLTGFEPGATYTINGTAVKAGTDGTIKIEEDWFGDTLSIVRKGNGMDKLDSDAQSLPIPARPQKPAPEGIDVSTAGGTGKLTGLTAGVVYEVSTDGGKTWVSKTADLNGEITGLAPGIYVVRVKAGTSNFASENSDPAKIGDYKKPENPNPKPKPEEPQPKPDDSTPKPDDSQPTPPANPPVKITPPAPTPGTTPPEVIESEDRKPGSTPRQEENVESEKNRGLQEEKETGGVEPDDLMPDSANTGTVIVTVVCEEEKCTAAVTDTAAVVKAVLTPDQQELVNGGETIEIRIDVTDISDQVPARDKEVIESGIEAYREKVPGLVLGMYVDISMFIKIGAGDWSAIAATNEPIEVVVNIPEKLLSDDRKFYIIRAHNGEYTFMNDLDDVPDTITISTDMFSSYAIAYVEAGAGVHTGGKCGLCHICPTFLGICYFIWLVVLVVIFVVMFVVLRRSKKEKPDSQ